MRKVYRFSLNTKTDKDVIEILEATAKTLRGQYIAMAIRQFQNNLPEYFKNPLNNTTSKTSVNFMESLEEMEGKS